MTFPWQNKSANSFPWEKQREAPSLPWQNKTEPAPLPSFQGSSPLPSYQGSSYQTYNSPYSNPYGSADSGYPGAGSYNTPGSNPYNTPGNSSYHWQSADPGRQFPWESQTKSSNPFDGKKNSFPWEKSSVEPSPTKDLFVFGREEHKKSSNYSSLYKEMKNEETKEETPLSKPGSHSSFYGQSKKAMFPWEKNKDPEPELEKSENYVTISTKEKREDDPVKTEDSKPIDDKPTEKVPSSPKTPKKKRSPRKSSKSPKSENKLISEPQITVDIDVKKSEAAFPDDNNIKTSEAIKTEKLTEILKIPEKTLKDETKSEESRPITSPPDKKSLSRSSSLARLTAKSKQDRVKSAPPVPKHINKKSEMMARKYQSAYAKPRISPKKEETEKEDEKPRISYRKELSMSEWVYPSPPEPVDWKTRSDQGLPVAAPTPDQTLGTQSELNLDSTSLRQAAFNKWVAKKKENKTFKKSDLQVSVIRDVEDIPSSENLRQEIFEEWYRARAIEADKRNKEKSKAEEQKLSEENEQKGQKKKNEAVARRLWEEKDKERKKKIKEKRVEEEKKKQEKAKDLEEKKKNAEKTFNSWKTNKDPKLKEEARKKKIEEKKKSEETKEEKEMAEIEAQKSFKAWKETKDQELKQKKLEDERQKKQKEQLLIREKREKDQAKAQAVQQWNEQKDKDKSKLQMPQHVAPWKNGPGKNAVISRDEMLMANIKHKKNRQKQGSVSKSAYDSENVTEVEFVK